MKFDTIIIGGGLSGLVAGIELQKAGQKVLIVSAGQSALHFFSGSLELYNYPENTEGDVIESILNVVSDEHPYKKFSKESLSSLIASVPAFFAEAGIEFKGESGKNHYRMTPLGVFKPAWLTLKRYLKVDDSKELKWKSATIANIDGFLDFHPNFIAASLSSRGVETKFCNISLPELDYLRKNPTEMRSTNIARALSGDVIGKLAHILSVESKGTDVIIMPAVLGLNSTEAMESLAKRTDTPIEYVATLPPSVPGICMQMKLKSYFQKLGGTYFLGDTVESGLFEDGVLRAIRTVNHSEQSFSADSFILASGSFFSRGIIASQSGVYEPIFNLDLSYSSDRSRWYEEDLFKAQPYMKFGVKTDASFNASINGEVIPNLYAIGSVLSGFNAIKEGCGAGVSILTALSVAKSIIHSFTE